MPWILQEKEKMAIDTFFGRGYELLGWSVDYIWQYHTATEAEIEKAKEIILKTLNKDEYTLYYKKMVEGKEYKQIAEEMGITVSNVGTKFSRLKKKVENLAKVAFSGPGLFIIRFFL